MGILKIGTSAKGVYNSWKIYLIGFRSQLPKHLGAPVRTEKYELSFAFKRPSSVFFPFGGAQAFETDFLLLNVDVHTVFFVEFWIDVLLSPQRHFLCVASKTFLFLASLRLKAQAD
jgi:hypothetical protein